jgi:arsenite-transporting ATPase
MMAKIHMFIGKGGVGKSTGSSLEAFRRTGNRLLVSMDPAHNLHDLFEKKLGSRKTRILPGLTVLESDLDETSRRYMASVRKELKGLYHYQQALNIDKYFDILKYAPGMEEYASLLVLEQCFGESAYDSVIVDTPPSALTLETIALPTMNLRWVSQLIKMREEIVQKKNSIANIRKENLETLSEDPVYAKLSKMRTRYETMAHRLKDPAFTEIVLVLNEDDLSLAESIMIRDRLDELGIQVGRVIVNKCTAGEDKEERIASAFPGCRMEKFMLADRPIQGIDALAAFAETAITVS